MKADPIIKEVLSEVKARIIEELRTRKKPFTIDVQVTVKDKE